MIDVQEGRRLKAAAEEMQEGVKDASIKDALETVDAWDRWLDANIAALLDAAERTEAADAWDRWLDANIAALLDAAERTEAAERELTAARIELRRMRAGELPGGWTEELQIATLNRWRAAIDEERGKG